MKAQIERLQRLHERMSQEFSPGEMATELGELDLLIEELKSQCDGFIDVQITHDATGERSESITFNGAAVHGVVSVGWHREEPLARPLLTLRLARYNASLVTRARS